MNLISRREKRRGEMNADVNRTYFWRKVLIIVDILLLIAFIVMVFVGDFMGLSLWNETGDHWKLGTLSTFGVGMLIWAIVLLILSVTVIVLTIMIRSPKTVTEEAMALEHKTKRRRR